MLLAASFLQEFLRILLYLLRAAVVVPMQAALQVLERRAFYLQPEFAAAFFLLPVFLLLPVISVWRPLYLLPGKERRCLSFFRHLLVASSTHLILPAVLSRLRPFLSLLPVLSLLLAASAHVLLFVLSAVEVISRQPGRRSRCWI